MNLRLRKWQSAGAEVTITLTRPPNGVDAMRVHEAVHAFSRALSSAPAPTGEEFLEFKEALSDIRSLRQEHRDLNGGGPGWSARNKAAWARADELFANEDEAAYDRQQGGHYG